MIVIVEGIDRVGKSTFCKMLQDKGYKLLDSKIHTDQFDVGAEVYDRLQEERTVAQAQLLSLLDKSEKIVIDRFHLSQAVYGLYERNRCTWPHMQLLEEFLCKNAILVYIKPTDILQSSARHGKNLTEHATYFDMLYDISSLQKVYGTYYSLDELLKQVEDIENGN